MAIQSACVPVGLHACAVNCLPQRLFTSLQSVVVRAIWGSSRRFRCKEILLSILVPGHRVDPHQACAYSCLVQWQRLMKSRGDLHLLFESTWAYICKVKCWHGPAGKIKKTLESIG
eukprot:9366875-Karenia_brevis.AAC.1